MDHENKSELEILADGRRCQSITTTTNNADGSVEVVKEIKEEVIPMRLAKKVITKMELAPTEEKTEVYHEDGSIETFVNSQKMHMASPMKESSNNLFTDKAQEKYFSKSLNMMTDNPQKYWDIFTIVVLAITVVVVVYIIS